MMLLGGDLGGTKTLLALAEWENGRLRIRHERRFASQDYPTFDAILEEFLLPASPIEAACLGVAGPTDGRMAQLTYLPWLLDSKHLETRFRLGQVLLTNDFAAAAHGLDLLEPEHLLTLQAGQAAQQSPRLIVGAGTGLGVAGLIRAGREYRVIPGEGGHMGFAPQTPAQGKLWQWLLTQGNRVTTEDIVSGPGLGRIYAFLGGDRCAPESISQAAMADNDPLAKQALELWLEAYGGFAGDLALHWLARGGVFLAGGIAAKLLRSGDPSSDVTSIFAPFLTAFNAKREHRMLAETMPVHLVRETRLGLLGALALARQFQEAGLTS